MMMTMMMTMITVALIMMIMIMMTMMMTMMIIMFREYAVYQAHTYAACCIGCHLTSNVTLFVNENILLSFDFQSFIFERILNQVREETKSTRCKVRINLI